MAGAETAIDALVKSSSVKNGQIKINQKLLDSALKTITEDSKTGSSVSVPKAFFEDILWPSWSSDKTDSHVLLVAVGISSKLDRHDDFRCFESDRINDFILRLLQIFHKDNGSLVIKTLIARAFDALFLNLHINAIRKSLAPFVSILIWGNIGDYENLLSQYNLQAQYSKQLKSLDNLSKKEKAESSLKTNWISNAIEVAIKSLDVKNVDSINYTKSILLLLRDLLAQLPTRKFLKSLLTHKSIISRINSSQIENEDLSSLLSSCIFYLKFPVDELTGEVISSNAIEDLISANYLKLQTLSNSLFPEKLQDLSFATYETLEDKTKLKEYLSRLDADELKELLKSFGFASLLTDDKELIIDSFIFQLSPYISPQSYLDNLGGTINEQSLSSQAGCYTPRLTGQFLSGGDFLLRNYLLYRQEAFADIKSHIERTVARFSLKTEKGKEKITGKSNYVFKLSSPDLNVTPNGTQILADLKISLSEFSNNVTKDWVSLKRGDLILLVKLGVKFPKGNAFEKIGVSRISSAIIKSSSRNKNKLDLKVEVKGGITGNSDQSEDNDEPFTLALRLPKTFTKYNQKLEKIWKGLDSSEDEIPEWLFDHLLGLGGKKDDELRLNKAIKLSIEGITKEAIDNAFPKQKITLEGQNTKRRKVDTSDGDTITSPFIINATGSEITLQQFDSESDGLDLQLNDSQTKALVSSLSDSLTLVEGPPGSGKKSIISSSVKTLTENYPNGNILIISKNCDTSKQLFEILEKFSNSDLLFNLSDPGSKVDKIGKANARLSELLQKVDELATSMNLDPLYGDNVHSATQFFVHQVKPLYEELLNKVKENKTVEALKESYPFAGFGKLVISENGSFVENLKTVVKHYSSILNISHEIEKLSPLSLSNNQNEIFDHLLVTYGKVVGVSAESYFELYDKFEKLNIKFDTLIISDASQLNEFETSFPLVLNNNSSKRAFIVGDTKSTGSRQQSFLDRLKNQGSSVIKFDQIYDKRLGIIEILKSYDPSILSASLEPETSNAGVLETIKLIELKANESDEKRAIVASALYASKFYQYLISRNYPMRSITILALDPLHEALLKEVFADHSPVIITIEGYRGQNNDIVILPLTDEPKELDEDLLLSAISASKKGFYIFCQNDVLEQDYMKNNTLLQKIYNRTKDHKLKLVENETFGNVTRTDKDKIASKEVNLETIEVLIDTGNT